MTEMWIEYENTTKEKTLCNYCASDKIRFVDFGKVNQRLNDNQISVIEFWVCRNCGKEFERIGTLYSPQDVNKARLHIAFLALAGYTAGSMIGYALLFSNLVQHAVNL